MTELIDTAAPDEPDVLRDRPAKFDSPLTPTAQNQRKGRVLVVASDLFAQAIDRVV